jgi:hypothetical protein
LSSHVLQKSSVVLLIHRCSLLLFYCNWKTGGRRQQVLFVVESVAVLLAQRRIVFVVR